MLAALSVLSVGLLLGAPPAAEDLAPARSEGVSSPTHQSVLPPNLVAPPTVVPLLAEMLARSETFRQQVEKLAAAPEVVVVIGFGTTSQLGGDAARSQLMLRGGALHRAEIWVPPVGARSVETISHEIEHVIERLDGGRLSGAGVTRSLDGVFETVRATRTGRLVADEFRASARWAEQRRRLERDARRLPDVGVAGAQPSLAP